MKPEQMAMTLRATNDAKAALVSVLAVWDHYGVGTQLDRQRMHWIVASLSRESCRLKSSLDAAMKAAS
jgi:hypothetical protein